MQKISTFIEEINKTKYSINEEYDFETTENPILRIYDNVEVDEVKNTNIKLPNKNEDFEYYQLFKKLATKMKINNDVYYYGFGGYTIGGQGDKKLMSMLDEIGIKYSSKISSKFYKITISKNKTNIGLIEKFIKG